MFEVSGSRVHTTILFAGSPTKGLKFWETSACCFRYGAYREGTRSQSCHLKALTGFGVWGFGSRGSRVRGLDNLKFGELNGR